MKFFLTALALIVIIMILADCSSGAIKKQSQAAVSESDTPGFLILKRDSTTSLYAYYNSDGYKVLGDYVAAYTDTLRDYCIVADPGFVLIDKNGRHIFDIFVYDNGPDYTSEGLYRVVINNKIGYVDSLSSQLVIPAIYECAYPFNKGMAWVSKQCSTKREGEHSIWVGENWFYIDKHGKKLNN